MTRSGDCAQWFGSVRKERRQFGSQFWPIQRKGSSRLYKPLNRATIKAFPFEPVPTDTDGREISADGISQLQFAARTWPKV